MELEIQYQVQSTCSLKEFSESTEENCKMCNISKKTYLPICLKFSDPELCYYIRS